MAKSSKKSTVANMSGEVGEIIEQAVPAVVSMDDIDAVLASIETESEGGEADVTKDIADNEFALEAAVSAVERYEADDANKEEAVEEVSTETVIEAAEVEAGDTEVEAEAKPEKPKKEKKERIFFSKQSDRIAHRLGDKLGEFMLLEIGDADLTGEQLQAKNKEVLAAIDGTAKKVGEKAAMLFKWLQQGGELNEVMKRTFTVMAKDGFITSGDKGNVQENLLAKPYSMGTARSQSNQMFCLFRALKIANTDGKGKLVPNPDSIILMKANATLGL